MTDDIDIYLKRLQAPLSDGDTTVRFAAVQGLGLQTRYPDECLPLLLRAINDPDQNIAGHALKFIGDLGTNGIGAIEPLKRIVETGNSYLAPRALKSLVSVAPGQAWPIVLEWLNSTNPQQRARALSLLTQFTTLTPEMLEHLKHATKDPDATVARTATRSLEKLRQKKKEEGVYTVVIEDEPTYGGKTLGQWLKRKAGQEDFPPEARRAVQAMGTNAIPALLARLVYVDSKYGLYDYDASLEAAGGFIMLGERGLPALPKLAELIKGDDERISLFALISCCNMGSLAVPVVASGFTNHFADVRCEALNHLTQGPLTAFPETRKRAIPDIITMLNDPEKCNRMNATNALWEIDRKAAIKAGVKAPVFDK